MSEFYNRKCGHCGKRLAYIGKQYGINHRFDFFNCPCCKKEYIARTSISGETVFEEVICD